MKLKSIIICTIGLSILGSCRRDNNSSSDPTVKTNKEKAIALLQSFQTGDQKALDYVSDDEYIQHNLDAPDGKEVLTGFITGNPTGVTVDIHRVIGEGDTIALHTTYGGVWNNHTPQIAFDVFRFKDGLIVEHWDNLIDSMPPNPSNHTQTDGATDISDITKTNSNRALIKQFIDSVMIGGKGEQIVQYFDGDNYIQHNPMVGDGLSGLSAAMASGNMNMAYSKTHFIVAEGNFVLTMSEGTFNSEPTAFYDLFRIQDDKIAEHWDVIATIPPESEWKNDNGKF